MIRRYLSEAKAAVASLLLQGSRVLEEAGLDNPSHESQAVMAAFLGVSRAGVFARLRDELDEDDRRAFLDWIYRRAKREPLQYITGQAEFLDLMFAVGPDTLIPRPETELLASEGISLLRNTDRPKIADIGTGSGCVAVALALHLPDAEVYAVDSSGAALTIAAENARTHGASDRIKFLRGDLFSVFEGAGLERGLDLIVSNPPYIPSGEIPSLQPEVLYEPVSALDGGPDGLSVIRRIIEGAPGFLKAGGALLMEIGFKQGDAVRGLVDAQPGFRFEKFVHDFADIERVLVAFRV